MRDDPRMMGSVDDLEKPERRKTTRNKLRKLTTCESDTYRINQDVLELPAQVNESFFSQLETLQSVPPKIS